MPIFVDDDAVVQVTIPVWVGIVPAEHLHPGGRTVRRSTKVGIVHPRAILGVGLDWVSWLGRRSSLAIIILLEIAGLFVEAVLVGNIMDEVVPVKEIGNRSVKIIRRILV